VEEDNTTTEQQAVDTGAETALPVEQTEDTADKSSDDVTSTEETGAEEALPESEDKLASFAKGQGIENVAELSEREQKLLKVAYDNNAEFQRSRQKATQLEKTMTTMSDEAVEQYGETSGQDVEVIKRLQRMEVKDSLREFWDTNPDAKKYEKQMAEIAVNSGLSGTPGAILEAAYAIAQSRDVAGVKSQAKRATLESLAQKQQAAVPTGNATTSGVSSSALTPQNVDKMVANMSLEEYQRRLPEINAALATR
jgi:hypothetical protein